MVRYFAAARAAAGVTEERLTLPDPATVRLALTEAERRHGAMLATVLQRCSFLVDEIAVHGRDTVLTDGAVLDVLPPFAGG
ncbi:MoaD/ThiS family protein [Nakamurella flavida]|uniref:MoaD/ThiS family protein n=1 Tax=Nakamurella flavida TaxID=363630 RepID=A0A938YM61_9ACTN|nr:MoaD/ThiS family protein [Nakamurella flavida]MBM9475598.1 MoaD/ThiS family protein [Nakamurella flavida]